MNQLKELKETIQQREQVKEATNFKAQADQQFNNKLKQLATDK